MVMEMAVFTHAAKKAQKRLYPATCGIKPGNLSGAEGESRTPTSIRPLDPEPSASTSSATSARRWRI